MNTIRMSATAARNNFFELLNQVAAGQSVIIEKDRKEVAIISPQKEEFDWKKFQKAADAAHGILKDYTVEEIAPAGLKDAWKGFGEWDKGIDFSKKKKKK